MHFSNIILIGMAAAGKSTIGKALAQQLGWAFVDTDWLLEAWWGVPLQTVADHLGRDAFLDAEAEQIRRLALCQCVIATGGSVVYRENAMAQLQQLGLLVYLHASFPCIEKRLNNPSSRGLAISPGQSLLDLYEERTPLYARFAQRTVPTDNGTPSTVCAQILKSLDTTKKDTLS